MSTPRRKMAVLSSSEQASLLRQPNQKAPTGLRNLCMLMLMLKAGLRVNEVLALRSADINWEEGKVHVAESGSAKERTLWLEEELVELLKKWDGQRPPESSYFFTTLKGGPLKDRYLREMVKRLSRKAGIKKDVHPHLLRSTFAVNLIKETNDIRLAQNALGHRDASTTQSYIKHLFNEHSMTYYDILGYRRSGIPAEDNPKPVLNGSLNGSSSGYLKSEENNRNKENWNIEKEGIKEEKKERTGKEERREEGMAEKPGHNNRNRKPNISMEIEPEEETGQKKPIPALKCSRCSYILRYKEDCPKCGASFTTILNHWRKNV